MVRSMFPTLNPFFSKWLALPGDLWEGWIKTPLVQASLTPNIDSGHCGPFLAISGKGGSSSTRLGKPYTLQRWLWTLWALPGDLWEGWITHPLVQASLQPSRVDLRLYGAFLAISGKGGSYIHSFWRGLMPSLPLWALPSCFWEEWMNFHLLRRPLTTTQLCTGPFQPFLERVDSISTCFGKPHHPYFFVPVGPN